MGSEANAESLADALNMKDEIKISEILTAKGFENLRSDLVPEYACWQLCKANKAANRFTYLDMTSRAMLLVHVAPDQGGGTNQFAR